jgi:curved DNA-binding protein CbpA
METGTQAASAVAKVILSRVVSEANRDGEKTVCHFNDGGGILLSNFLGALIRPGDEINFPLANDSAAAGTEIYIRKTSSSGRSRDLYQAPISYAAQPKADKRERLYVRTEVPTSRLGISSIHLPCEVVRDYFYVARRREPWERQTSLYDVLRITPTASLAELRVASRLRQLQLRAAGASNRDSATLERAFNILAQPELRACYDSLLKDSSAPALFPYGGFGSILVAGDRSRDGQTFFATQILSFQPEHRERRFHAPLRNFDFYQDHAIYRDVRRKLEVTLDQSAMPIIWEATWNRWKHLLGAKVELQGTFVQTGKYQRRNGQWSLNKWETALPSRLHVKVPANIAEQIEAARKSYHRFGEFSDALDQIRARIEREPLEREQLRSLCWDLGMPGDFDVSQISWQPDYDAFFYQQLCKRARRLYLFRDEYIFDLPRATAVETPQLGHATYLFSKPHNLESFLAAYIATTKEAIRQNRANVADQLGFLGRVVHGSNPRVWLRALTARLGEAADTVEVASEESEYVK